MASMREQRATALRDARAIDARAKSAGRKHTDAELKEIDRLLDEVDRLDKDLVSAAESKARFDALASLNPAAHADGKPAKGFLRLKDASDGVKSVLHEVGLPYSAKSLIAVGSTATNAVVLDDSPVTLGKPATSLFDIIPARFVEGTDQFSYLRQTVRDNNAAPVATGAVKPTSIYTLEKVTDTLKVVAHISEPVPVYWLKDVSSLDKFLRDEMGYGLQVALEDQTVNGNGVDPNLDGVLATSGIQVQAFVTSALVSLRKALTAAETMGYAPNGIAMHPTDWEALELLTTTTGEFLLGAPGEVPIDRVARRVWGLPVALTLSLAAGTALVVSEDSVGIVADPTVSFEYGVVNDDFQRNQVRGRAELRAEVEVTRPAGIVKVALKAA